MTTLTALPTSPDSPYLGRPLPDHLQLPCSDGLPVENFQEHPLNILLTTSIWPLLVARHPDGQFAIGHDSGIYFRLTDPPLDGCRAPDWFYIPGVPPMLGDTYRRSYVLWQEILPPYLLMEYVSKDGSEERDRTPWKGKFWIYEHAIRPSYYVIFDARRNLLEVYRHEGGHFRRLSPGNRDHYPIEDLGVELGIWHGTYAGMTLPWLRFYDLDGNLLPSAEEREELEKKLKLKEKERADEEKERADQEKERADQENERADQEKERADFAAKAAQEAQAQSARLAAKLRELGVDPSQL